MVDKSVYFILSFTPFRSMKDEIYSFTHLMKDVGKDEHRKGGQESVFNWYLQCT